MGGAQMGVYEDNFGFWDIDEPEELAFFEHVQRQSVFIACERCERSVRLISSKTLCATCVSALECGAQRCGRTRLRIFKLCLQSCQGLLVNLSCDRQFAAGRSTHGEQHDQPGHDEIEGTKRHGRPYRTPDLHQGEVAGQLKEQKSESGNQRR